LLTGCIGHLPQLAQLILALRLELTVTHIAPRRGSSTR
jgi:hypothetical protein